MLRHPCPSRTIPLALNSSFGCWDFSPGLHLSFTPSCFLLPTPNGLLSGAPPQPLSSHPHTPSYPSPADNMLFHKPSCKPRYPYPQEPLGSTCFQLNLSAFPRPLSPAMPHPLSSCLGQSTVTLPLRHNHIPPAPRPANTTSSLWNLSSRFHRHENSLCSQAHLQGQISIKSLLTVHGVAKESDMTEKPNNNKRKLGFCLSEYFIHHSLRSLSKKTNMIIPLPA